MDKAQSKADDKIQKALNQVDAEGDQEAVPDAGQNFADYARSMEISEFGAFLKDSWAEMTTNLRQAMDYQSYVEKCRIVRKSQA